MRRYLLVLPALLTLVATSGCDSVSSKETYPRRLSTQEIADKFVSEVLYIKDPATNLCYAYYWGGTYHGGPAITLVPEDSIPPERLLVGRPKP